MSGMDKMRNSARQLRGRIKRNAGEVVGDPRLQAEGQSEEMGASAAQAGEKLKDAVRSVLPRRRPRRRY
jgi:uncharacterized protein YjbJ (UPF0337 family)